MLNIYDVNSAQRSILLRKPLTMMDFPSSLLERTSVIFGDGKTPFQAVAEILESVRVEGDKALRIWSKLLDGTEVNDFLVSPDDLGTAYKGISYEFLKALLLARDRIREFHALQPVNSWETTTLGGKLGQRVTPIESVGIYVPGGSAPLPSSLLMSVLPAQVAGVPRIIVCTPPGSDPSILAAAYLCGISEVYQIGGAQAIGAMAFGTESIPKVDKIVGAGNIFVTLAKQQVFGIVGLDGLAGPTETMIIADSTVNPAWIAADLLAQAEHDVMASAILLTNDKEFAKKVQISLSQQIEGLTRGEIIAQSLANKSGIVLVPDFKTAIELANDYAPEHLCLAVENPELFLGDLRNAGGIFIGEYSFEVLGDYIAGPSHVMPTGGSARYSSPLNVLDFVKITSLVALDEEKGIDLSKSAAQIATVERLTAHASAASFRISGG